MMMPYHSVSNVIEGDWGISIIYKQQDENPLKLKKSRETVQTIPAIYSEGVSNIDLDDYDSTDKVSEETKSDSEKYKLSNLYAFLFSTVLEDSALQMKLLFFNGIPDTEEILVGNSESGNLIEIIKIQTNWDSLLRKKYGVRDALIVDELHGIDPKKLRCREYKIAKLNSDGNFVFQTIQDTYIDLSLFQHYAPLQATVDDIVAKSEYRINLIAEESKNRIQQRDLTKQLRVLRNHIKSFLYDADMKIGELCASIEDSTMMAESRGRFIDNWQRARSEQHDHTISSTEELHTDSMQRFKEEADREHRVHNEVHLLMNILIEETLHKIEIIMEKYESDMESMDLKLQIQKNHLEDQITRRGELEDQFAQHAELIANWVNFKDERKRAQAYREKMNRSATVVQAWWRGFLVRQELGPFKPKRRPPPKPDAKKN